MKTFIIMYLVILFIFFIINVYINTNYNAFVNSGSWDGSSMTNITKKNMGLFKYKAFWVVIFISFIGGCKYMYDYAPKITSHGPLYEYRMDTIKIDRLREKFPSLSEKELFELRKSNKQKEIAIAQVNKRLRQYNRGNRGRSGISINL